MTTTTVKEKMMYPGINVIRNSKRHPLYNFKIYERLIKVCFYAFDGLQKEVNIPIEF